MNVPLEPELEKLVQEKVKSGRYQTAAEVFRDALLLLKERDENRERLEALLQEGLESGEATEMTSAEWEQIRREVHSKRTAPKTE